MTHAYNEKMLNKITKQVPRAIKNNIIKTLENENLEINGIDK